MDKMQIWNRYSNELLREFDTANIRNIRFSEACDSMDVDDWYEAELLPHTIMMNISLFKPIVGSDPELPPCGEYSFIADNIFLTFGEGACSIGR